MASIKGSARGGNDASRVAKIKDQIGKHINQYFAGTLGQEKDIVNIVNALVCRESSFDFNSTGPTINNSGTKAYLSSSAIQKILKSGTPAQVASVEEGYHALGLTQVLGFYYVRGAYPSGKCEIERIRPDLASILCVNPGDSLYDFILGEANFPKAILGGLVLLESKYRAVFSDGNNGYAIRYGNEVRRYPTKLSGAVSAYLGLGQADQRGTTPFAYSHDILGGAFYTRANGDSPIVYNSSVRTASAVGSGPATNSTSGGVAMAKVFVPGCAA